MAIVRWRPFGDLLSIREEMNRLFDDFFSRVPRRMEEVEEGIWSPNVDISETEDEIMVAAEIPGMTKDDIKISIQDNVLDIRGEKKEEKETKKRNYHRIERSFGAFQRSFTLPVTVAADKIKATYKDGVLKIRLPKTEEAKTKEIPITVE